MKRILLICFVLISVLSKSQNGFYNGWGQRGNTLGAQTYSLGSVDNFSFVVVTNGTRRMAFGSDVANTASVQILGTLETTGSATLTGGISIGAAPTAANIINLNASVAGQYGILITNLSSGASSGSRIRLGNNSNQATIIDAGTGATNGNNLYPLSLNFIQDDAGGFTFNQSGGASSGAYTRFRISSSIIGSQASISNQTAGSNIPSFKDESITRGWATGAIALQEEAQFDAMTYTSTAASTITKAVRARFTKAIAGTNITITNNFSADFNGNVSLTTAGLYFSDKVIDVTTGDAATINSTVGRFRKDATGTIFTLTDSYITANSIIILTQITAGLTGGTHLTVQAGAGSATITFEVAATGAATAPSADMDINFIIMN